MYLIDYRPRMAERQREKSVGWLRQERGTQRGMQVKLRYCYIPCNFSRSPYPRVTYSFCFFIQLSPAGKCNVRESLSAGG